MTPRKPTPQQRRLLRLLAKAPASDSDLAKVLDVSRQRVGQRVAMLRHHGWLEGRMLTEAGREVSK